MKTDMNETIMLMANGDMGEFDRLQETSVEKFLTRYKIIIEEKVKDVK